MVNMTLNTSYYLFVFFIFCSIPILIHAQTQASERITFSFGLNDANQLASMNSDAPAALYRRAESADVSNEHGIFYSDDGTLFAYGQNNDGQLGISDTSGVVSAYQNVSIPSENNILHVAAGSRHSLVVDASGSLFATGDNTNGQFGNGEDGSTSSTDTFIDTGFSFDAPEHIRYLVAQGDTSYLLYQTGENGNGILFAWGSNPDSLYSSESESNTPIQVATDISSIAVGNAHLLQLNTDGVLFASGSNTNGQTGTGSSGSSTQVTGDLDGATVTVIGAGFDHSLAVTSDGSLYAWGNNNNNQLGLGDDATGTNTISEPTLVDNSNNGNLPFSPDSSSITHIAGGAEHSILVTDSNRIYAAGSNEYGQLGVDTSETSQSNVFIEVELNYVIANDPIVHVSCGEYTSMVTTDSGLVLVWGRPSFLGVDPYMSIRPHEVALPVTFSFVYARDKMSFGIEETNGTLHVWGDNSYQALVRDPSLPSVPLPREIEEFSNLNITAFGIGGSQASETFWMASSKDELMVWGNNGRGQLATGDADDISVPSNTSRFEPNIRSIALGDQFSAIVNDASNRIEGAGDNTVGQLGAGNLGNRLSPLLLKSDSVQISAAGSSHILVLTTSNELFVTGLNDYGQVGQPEDVSEVLTFERIDLFDDNENAQVVNVAAGGKSSFAIISDGRVYAWGDNREGQLGVSDIAGSNETNVDVIRTPQLVPLPSDFVTFKVSTNGQHTLVVGQDGRLFGFGKNDMGQLGLGDQDSRLEPTEIDLGFRALDIAVGGSHSTVLAGRRPCIDNCNNRGECDFMVGVCNCYEGFFGDACGFKECPQNCNEDIEQGTCNTTTGVCTCVEPYQGEACQYLRCPNDCNGNGACNTATGVCQCFQGFTGEDCQGSGALGLDISVGVTLFTLIVSVGVNLWM